VSGSGISWAVCKSAPRSRQITTPAPHHSVFTDRMPYLPPNQQRQSTECTVGLNKHQLKRSSRDWLGTTRRRFWSCVATRSSTRNGGGISQFFDRTRGTSASAGGGGASAGAWPDWFIGWPAAIKRQSTVSPVVVELSKGWVDPCVGSGWVEIFQFLVGLVGLDPLQQKYYKLERIMLMYLKHG